MVSLRKKQILLSFIALVMVITSLFSFGGLSNKAEADLDPASRLICKFEDGKTIVNFYSTDYLQYILRSKSAVTSSQDVQSNLLNKLLMMSGFNFVETNEAILGRPLNPSEVPEEPATSNSSKVSAFDRFGMSGMKWSSYQGEWKYYHVDACANSDKASPTNYGAFYEGRLEPKSPYNEVATSIDNRSIQFNKGFASNLMTAFSDTISNFFFFITKAIVTLTIVFVGLSFTDLTTFLGMMEDDGTGTGTATGIFTSLYDGLFSGFVVITFMFTAMVIMYKGLIKRELRLALNTILKTIAIFLVAGIMAANPSYWIGIPNKIATYGQAIMLSTLNGMYTEENEYALCTTDVASIDENVNIDLANESTFATEFEKTNQNMKALIGCKMWEVLLFKPWVKGQFGADYEDLNASNVRNENSSWVGTPSVPLGGEVTVDNWALFHLSTQTNAHAQVGGGMPSLVNGVNADWWRVVDAMSNYEEEKVTEVDSNGISHEFDNPVKNEPLPYWQSWIGNNELERIITAFISITFGIVGSIAPLVFGLASAVYGLGITLLMMVSPIFLLFGTWGGKGDSIFFGWLSALINTVIKKIIVGLLLVMSLTLSMITMDMIEDIGFIKSFMLMCVTALVLVKNKDKFLDMVAKVDLGGAFDPRTKANQFMQKTKSAAQEVGKLSGAAVTGSVAGVQSGQGWSRGAQIGVRRQLENRLQRSSIGREVLRQERMSEGGEQLASQTCIMCHMPLGVNRVEMAYEDDDGNYYCVNCAEEAGLESLYEVIAGDTEKANAENKVKKMYEEGYKNPIKENEIRKFRGPSESWISHESMRKTMKFKNVNGEYQWDDEAVRDAIKLNFLKLRKDASVHRTIRVRIGKRLSPPSIPAPLTDYIDTALINSAWSEDKFNLIEKTYRIAWMKWYEDNAKFVSGVDEETIELFKEELNKELDGDYYVPTENEITEALNEYLKSEVDSTSDGKGAVYKYSNGEIVCSTRSIEEADRVLSDD